MQESIKQKENTRFYLQTKDEVYCSSVAIFVGNLPPNLSERQYEKILMDLLKKRTFLFDCDRIQLKISLNRNQTINDLQSLPFPQTQPTSFVKSVPSTTSTAL